jgi:hypothetical protein
VHGTKKNNNALIAEWIQLREQFIAAVKPPNLQLIPRKSEYVWFHFQEWRYENLGLRTSKSSIKREACAPLQDNLKMHAHHQN